MQSGSVKFFNDTKGWGFITTDDGVDVFVHHSAIEMKGRRTLADAQRVQVEFERGQKGMQAVRVIPE